MIGPITWQQQNLRNQFFMFNCSQNVLASTAATAEAVMYTYTIPAGTLGLQDGIYIESSISVPATTNIKNFQLRMGAQGCGLAGAIIQNVNTASSSFSSLVSMIQLINLGSLSAQLCNPYQMGPANGAAVNFAAAVDIVLSGWCSAGTAIGVNSYVRFGVQRVGQ